MRTATGVEASRALQGAQHRIFVEGSSDEQIDPIVITELLRVNKLSRIAVSPMGGCENVRSASQALVRHHPSYYFVIDRDDLDDRTVENSWENFHDEGKNNLIIWRKRELENYFIDPDYLAKSSWLADGWTKRKLKTRILKEANKRIFLDAANLTILKLHSALKKPFVDHFKNCDDFPTEKKGETKLKSLSAIQRKVTSIKKSFDKSEVIKCYHNFCDELSGGILPLKYGSGKWLDRMSGKEIFRSIAGECFRVETLKGNVLQGKEQNNEVAKDLIRLSLIQQPSDFSDFVALLQKLI